jgi:hypothetical protein
VVTSVCATISESTFSGCAAIAISVVDSTSIS